MRQFKERPNHFINWKKEFLQRLRLSRDTVGYIVDYVSATVEIRSNK